METIGGFAAGVPFTAIPPGGVGTPAPLVVTWHLLDAPRTDAAFAAALPMTGLAAWRVHLGMPLCGARMVDGRLDAAIKLARRDALGAFLAPFVRQAAEEFSAALAAIRDRFPVGDGPVAILGGSLGGAVALQVLTTGAIPIGAVALVNPAVRIRSVVGLTDELAGHPYRWTPEAERIADELDFVARVERLTAEPPLLLISGEQDHPDLRRDAADLVGVLRARYREPEQVELTVVPELAHSLADEPGLEPAPQRPATRVVDGLLTRWFTRVLPG